MDKVVENFHDKKFAVNAAKAGSGDVIKVTGPQKKQYFTPEESKNVQMSLPKFPRPETLYEAVTTYQEGLVTHDQLATLARVWPPDSNPAELANMELGENEIWDRAEAYMIQILEPSDLIHRLKAWNFVNGYAEDKVFMDGFIKQIAQLFVFIEDTEVVYKVMGMALAIGNIMNGGTPKGRSDGYELKVVGKFASTKGNDGKTMLAFILTELNESMADQIAKFKDQAKCFNTRATDIDVYIAKIREVKGNCAAAKDAYKEVTTSGEEPDNFSKQMGNDIKAIEDSIAKYEKQG